MEGEVFAVRHSLNWIILDFSGPTIVIWKWVERTVKDTPGGFPKVQNRKVTVDGNRLGQDSWKIEDFLGIKMGYGR